MLFLLKFNSTIYSSLHYRCFWINSKGHISIPFNTIKTARKIDEGRNRSKSDFKVCKSTKQKDKWSDIVVKRGNMKCHFNPNSIKFQFKLLTVWYLWLRLPCALQYACWSWMWQDLFNSWGKKSHVMRLWYYSSSLNSFFKRAVG